MFIDQINMITSSEYLGHPLMHACASLQLSWNESDDKSALNGIYADNFKIVLPASATPAMCTIQASRCLMEQSVSYLVSIGRMQLLAPSSEI